MGYEIVKYRPEFKEGVLDLFKLLWSPNASLNAACFHWKYERNPYQREPVLYLALEQGRVVGMRGMVGAKWEAGVPRRQFVIPCACDLVIAPDHRNRGLISRIMRFAFDDMRKRGTGYIFNLSAGQVTFMNSLAMGWRSIGPLGRVVRVNRRETPGEQLKRHLRRWPSAFYLAKSVKNHPGLRRCSRVFGFSESRDADPFFHLDQGSRAGRCANSPGIFLERSPRPDQMADLVQRLENEGRIRHVKDRAYLEWRFEHPLSDYRFLYGGQLKLEGYLVLGTRAQSTGARHQNVYVSDWDATSPEVFEALLKTAIRLGRFDKLVVWQAVVPRPARKLLSEAGFRGENETVGKPEYHPTVLVKATGDQRSPEEWRLAGNPLLDSSRWDVRPIDSL